MKNTKRKGFTIVELVIVIAVIAILAAVLIPTFASLVNKANQSKDTQLVKNLNTALASDAKEHKTMSEALAAAEAFGYDVAKINASATGNEILWDSANDLFCYFNGTEIEYIPDYTASAEVKETEYWQICTTMPETQKYSIYWVGENAQTLELTVGFDAGQTSGHTLTFTGTNANIYTNGGTLEVNNSSADVNHYGFANEVKVTECANASYHEFGKVVKMTITKGHVEIESGALISKIESVDTDGSVTNNKGGYIIDALDSVTKGDATSFSLEIATAADLASFRDSVNSGMTYEGLTVKLTADIDLGVYANWNPIGNRYTLNGDKIVDFNDNDSTAVRRIFKGTFDGQGHTISGMNINSLATNYPGLRAAANDTTKSSYAALFGYISGATLKDFTLNGSVIGVDVAGVVGITGGDCTIDGVTSNVDLTGKNGTNEEEKARGKVAAFVCCPKGTALTITNCVNNGSISCPKTTSNYCGPVGGFVAYLDRGALTLKNCVNNGAVSVDSESVGGFVGIVQYTDKTDAENTWETGWDVVIENCTNNGNLESYHVGALIAKVALAGSGTLKLDGCKNTGKIEQKYYSNLSTHEMIGYNNCNCNGVDGTYSVGDYR